MLRQTKRRGTGLLGWILAGIVAGLLFPVIPTAAQSPCGSAVLEPDAPDTLRSDCEALWAFYADLNDPGVLDDPSNPNAWLPTTPFTRWQGVVIGDSAVEGLILPGAGLRGPSRPGSGNWIISSVWCCTTTG